jgi:glutamyl-Q tRNA(Asp) synthetase
MLEDLAWLGFAADEPPVRQSERGPVYEAALERLRRKGLVYACDCTRGPDAPHDDCQERTGSSAGL